METAAATKGRLMAWVLTIPPKAAFRPQHKRQMETAAAAAKMETAATAKTKTAPLAI